MKIRAVLLLIVLLVPVYYLVRWMRRAMNPSESAGRLFLFLLAIFVTIVVYTMLVVGVIVRVFPPGIR